MDNGVPPLDWVYGRASGLPTYDMYMARTYIPFTGGLSR
jgi:hypothetical protein